MFLVFVYGATGAGKTYMMLGSPGNPGLTFRTVSELYNRVEATKEEVQCEIQVSYLEIYNETAVDLLQPGKIKLSFPFNDLDVQISRNGFCL